jgi:hypothetical protein
MCVSRRVLPSKSRGVWTVCRSGLEAFVRRGRVVPIEEAFVRPEKSGVCAPRGMCHPEEKAFVCRLKNETTS